MGSQFRQLMCLQTPPLRPAATPIALEHIFMQILPPEAPFPRQMHWQPSMKRPFNVITQDGQKLERTSQRVSATRNNGNLERNSLSASTPSNQQIRIIRMVVHDEIPRGRVSIPTQRNPFKWPIRQLRQYLTQTIAEPDLAIRGDEVRPPPFWPERRD